MEVLKGHTKKGRGEYEFH